MKIEVGKKYKLIKSFRDWVPVGSIVEVESVYEMDGSADVRFDEEETVIEVELSHLGPCDDIKPAHYDTGIDTIAFLRANCPPEQVEGFLRGNALKYLQRYDKKNGVDDLRKAKHYVEMLIEEVEGRE